MNEAETNHIPDQQLSAYLDGDVPAGDDEALKAHLAGCATCRRGLDDLRGLVEAAGALEDRPPARDLWPGIAGAVGRDRGSARVHPIRPRGRMPARRLVQLSLSQLAAAAVLLVLLSGGGVWWIGQRADARGPAVIGPSSAVPTARTASVDESPPEGYAAELERLQRTLDAHRDRLDPNTVRIVEKNLAVIDRAIRESREALAVDPGNAFLESHLDRAYRTKIEYLREATRMAEWSS